MRMPRWSIGYGRRPVADLVLRSPSEVAFIEEIAKGNIATGRSSKVMAHVVLGWRDDVGCHMPYDCGDWGRCIKTYEAAPDHLQRMMRPIMDLYYRRLVEYVGSVGGAEWRMKGVVWPPVSEP